MVSKHLAEEPFFLSNEILYKISTPKQTNVVLIWFKKELGQPMTPVKPPLSAHTSLQSNF